MLLKIILIVFLISGNTPSCFSQTSVMKKNDAQTPVISKDANVSFNRPYILKTNLAGPLSLYYEMQVQPEQSVQLSINRINYGFLFGGDVKYFALTAAYKFYLSKKESSKRRPNPSGFYLSPYIRYVNATDITTGFISINTKTSEVAYNLFGGGGIAGYQIIFGKGLTLDFFAGAGYLPLSTSRIIYTQSSYKSEVKPDDHMMEIRLGVCIGFAFGK